MTNPKTPDDLADDLRKLETDLRKAADEAWEMAKKDLCEVLHDIARRLEGYASELDPTKKP